MASRKSVDDLWMGASIDMTGSWTCTNITSYTTLKCKHFRRHPARTSTFFGDMPQTYSSGVPARGREVLLISLERCSRLATVASEENDGSSMIGRFRLASKRTVGRNCRRITGICCWHCCQHSVRPHHLPSLFSRFCLFVQSRAAHLTPQHWLLCHLG